MLSCFNVKEKLKSGRVQMLLLSMRRLIRKLQRLAISHQARDAAKSSVPGPSQTLCKTAQARTMFHQHQQQT